MTLRVGETSGMGKFHAGQKYRSFLTVIFNSTPPARPAPPGCQKLPQSAHPTSHIGTRSL